MLSSYLQIFLIGLFGSMHCIGMCGGFVALYSFQGQQGRPSFVNHILYNAGRISTYSLLGGLVGYAGSFTSYIGQHRGVPGSVLLIAGTVMILMGLNLAGVLGERGLFELTDIASTGKYRQALRRSLAMGSSLGVFLFGVLLGFLPCGLLYPVLIQAAVSGGFPSGMLTMAVFGLGTMPAMMSFGLLVTKLRPHFKLALYRIAAVLIILLGIQTLLRGMAFLGWISAGRFW